MSQLSRYESYKDSGVQWLGEIPSHWMVKQLKFAVTCNDEALGENTEPEYEILYVDISSVSLTEGIKHKEELVFENAPSRARRVVKSGDVLVSTVRTYLKAITYVKSAEDNLIASTGFAVLRPSEKFDSKFIGYWIQSEGMVGNIVANSVGVSYPAINATDLVRLPVVELPLSEQKIITDFLDKRLAQVDALIVKQETLLEKLAEQRIALISHAVTKGLNPDVELKESGIQWFQEIPKTWDVKQLKFVINKIQTGSTPPSAISDYYSSDDIIWFGPADFSDESYILNDSIKKISSLALEDKVVKPIPNNSIMIIGIGATLGKVAITSVECTTNQQINSLVMKDEVSTKYMMYLLNSLKDIIKLLSSASTLGIINQEKTKCLEILVPPKNEQQQISDFLDKELDAILKVKNSVEKTITKLKEYRSTLITQVVTGKIDVRNFQVN